MKKIQYKSSIYDLDEKQGIVKIRVSAFGNVDSYGDIMDKKAFNKTISDFKSGGRSRIKHLKNHNPMELLGLPIEMTSTASGLDIVSKMNISKQSVKDVYSDYLFMAENGNTLEHSIGYLTVNEEKSEEGYNILKEVNLKEYSTLDFLGANGETPLLDIKQMIQKGDYSDEKYIALENKIKQLESKIEALRPLEAPEPQQVKEDNSELKLIYHYLENS